MRRLRALWVVVAALTAVGQEGMNLEAVQGAWYGWLVGTGMEVKIAAMPDGAIAYLKTVQPEMQPFLQEVAPSVDGNELLLRSLQAPQPFSMRFHFEGEILFGTYTEGASSYTVALARSMPDVERLFAAPSPLEQASPMEAAGALGRRQASANNLRRIGEALRAYASQSADSMYPALSTIPGMLAPAAENFYPTFLSDASLFVAPGHPDAVQLRKIAHDDPLVAINDTSYWYLGYLVPNETIAEAYLKGYVAQAGMSETAQFGNALKSEGIEVPRLRTGIEQLLVSDLDDPAEFAAVASQIPVMIERPGIQGSGGHVLFLDGHVEFLAYPGPFPMNEGFIEGLRQLEAEFSPIGDDDGQDDTSSGSL